MNAENKAWTDFLFTSKVGGFYPDMAQSCLGAGKGHANVKY